MYSQQEAELYERVTYPVGVDPIDEAQAFTIIAVGEAVARIDWIEARDYVTGLSYRPYPDGVQAYCTPGAGNLRIGIHLTNVGTIDGTLFIKLYANGVLIDTHYVTLAAGGGGTNYFTGLDMPPRDYDLTVEVGH